MYTGTPARDWTALRAQGAAAVQRAEAGLPWEQEAPRTGSDQDTWLLSFIDVLTLLLTLFVLLLAYQKDDVKAVRAELRPEHAAVVVTTGPAALPAADAHAVSRTSAAPVEPVPAPSPVTSAKVVTNAQPPSAQPAEPVSSDAARPATRDTLADDRAGSSPAGISASVAVQPSMAERHPLMWLDDAPWTESVPAMSRLPEPAAEATPAAQHEPPLPPHESAEAPLQRLLADLENSALAGRVEVNVLPDAVNLQISDNILFAPASAALTGGGRGLLDNLASTLKTLPYALSVEGHTDNVPIRTPRYPSNWELAAARASAVTRHLIEQGVAAERVRAIGYADTRPRADNATPEGRARNRRVAFILRMSMP